MLRTAIKLGLVAIALSMFTPCAVAKDKLPIPRFVAIKAAEANVRTGPSVRYPVVWVYHRRWLPVEVRAEFEQWRKIRDKEGDEGWIHESLLSGRRHVFVLGDNPQVLYRLPDRTAYPVIKVEPGVMAELLECRREWCKIEAGGNSGWLEQASLWGVYAEEVVE